MCVCVCVCVRRGFLNRVCVCVRRGFLNRGCVCVRERERIDTGRKPEVGGPCDRNQTLDAALLHSSASSPGRSKGQ